MVKAGEGNGEVLKVWALLQGLSGQFDVGYDCYFGVLHAGHEGEGVLFAVHEVSEVVALDGEVFFEGFELFLADAEGLYTYDVHGCIGFVVVDCLLLFLRREG